MERVEANNKEIKLRSFFWNTLGAGFNSIQSAIFLFISSRLFEIEVSGSITIAFTIANLLLTFAKYGLRNYQATDTNNKYSFLEFYYTRIITTFVTLAFCFIYLFYNFKVGRYDYNKTIIVLLISLLKITESVEDVIVGSFQKNGRLDIGSKWFTIHIVLSTIVSAIVAVIYHNIFYSLICGLITAFIISLIFVFVFFKKYNHELSFNIINVKNLLLEGLTLCISSVMYIYLGNSPKFMSDLFLTEYDQVVVGYLMLPMFVVLLLSNFIIQPLLKSLSDSYHNEKATFNKMIKKQSIIIGLISLLILFLGLVVVLPLLGVVYNIDLSTYRYEFVILELGVTIYTFSYYYSIILTTMRLQKHILIGYVLGLITIVTIGKTFSLQYGILGCAIVYVISNLITMIYYFWVMKHFNMN